MHALGYNHLAPESGQNSVMVVGSPMAGDDYYSTGDVVLIQERYCGTSLQRINSEYKRTLQCESTFHNATRLNFYDRFCDGVADCEDGEDEESLTSGWERRRHAFRETFRAFSFLSHPDFGQPTTLSSSRQTKSSSLTFCLLCGRFQDGLRK